MYYLNHQVDNKDDIVGIQDQLSKLSIDFSDLETDLNQLTDKEQ